MTRASRLVVTFAGCLIATPVFASQLRQTQPATAKNSSAASDGTSLDELSLTARLDEIRRQRDAYDADQLVKEAVKDVLAGRDESAEPLFARAVQLDESNQRALQGLRETRERLGLSTAPSALIERAAKERRIEQQEAQFRFDASLAEAQRGINSGTPEGFQAAKLAILRAKEVRSQCAGAFSRDELKELDGRLQDHDLQLNKAIQKRDDAERQAQQDEWRRRIKEARVHDITLK